MTTKPRHRTARERAALESARVAVARAQAHAQRPVVEAEPVVEPSVTAPPPPTLPRFVPQEESTSSAAAWRRRCRQIREEIDAERARSNVNHAIEGMTP